MAAGIRWEGIKALNLKNFNHSTIRSPLYSFRAIILINVIFQKCNVKRAKILLEPKWFNFLANVLLVTGPGGGEQTGAALITIQGRVFCNPPNH